MEKMKWDAPLDYAVFQLSPKHSRDGSTEKLASGLLKPFATHLKVVEEQVTSAAQSIKLDRGRHKNAETWFTKGTLDRFVQFVNNPEVLELVDTLDAEMSQLEAARRIYSQGIGDQPSGGGGSGLTATDDATKKELLRAIDVRLVAAEQDLNNSCARAAAAGFNADTVPELQMFADGFGAHRLNEACGKYMSLCERRPNLINQWRSRSKDRAIRSSCISDMSINDLPSPPCQEPTTHQQPNLPPITFPLRRTCSSKSNVEMDGGNKPDNAPGEYEKKDETSTPVQTQARPPSRQLSVQDRINMFENKQKENSGGKPVVKSVELRRLSSDVSMMGAAAEKAVLRRWSGASDMSIDLSAEKDSETSLCTPSSALFSQENKVSDLNKDTEKSSSMVKPVIPSKSRSEIALVKDQDSSMAQNKPTGSEGGWQFHVENPKETRETRDESVAQLNLKSSWKTMEESWVSQGVSGSRLQQAFDDHNKEILDNSSSAQKELRSIEETEAAERNESLEDFGPRRMKFNRNAADLGKRTKVIFDGNSRIPLYGKIATEAQEELDSFATPPEQPQRKGRHTKANHERNDELQIKANELEKLFAEHQLRGPADLSNSARKGKLDDAQHVPMSSFQYSKPIEDTSPQFSNSYKSNEPAGSMKNKTKSNAPSSLKIIDSQKTQNKDDALMKSFSELSVSEGSRGKLYQKYIQKRDAKLKEDWSSNRSLKEARLKSMQDSLERNKSDMKAKLSGSADRQDSVSSARRRAERLRSYNSLSVLKREQEHLDFGDCVFNDDALDFQEKNHPTEERAVDGTAFEDGVYRPTQGKKLIANNRNFSSTTPRSSTTPITRTAAKTSSGYVKRRMQPENPLAQSVPNFSDLRKENTKPSSGGVKATRSQVRNHTRTKSITEEMTTVKEDKSRRLQALRKSSANPSEFKDMPTLDADGAVLTQIKFDEEIPKNVGTKPFLRKGSRAARTTISRQRISAGSEPVNDMDENDDIASEPDEYKNTVKDEGEEEFKTSNAEENATLADREPELDKFVTSESENGDETPTFSAVDQALGSKFPREIPSHFLPVDSMQDWHNGNPMSWNSRTQHPFSYLHETSDVDASVDSPIGSPSWNSHSINAMESDAARMRKKWGTAQKPMAVVHSSNSSSRKDMTSGFKRLLKFGRKNRGSDAMADWVSATTSEGDDDTEDGRDTANHSSEDLRKSRMGFSQADGFNESEFFNESEQSSQSSIPAPPPNFKLREDHVSGTSIKAPRSFFSLSTFRSKGNECKPR